MEIENTDDDEMMGFHKFWINATTGTARWSTDVCYKTKKEKKEEKPMTTTKSSKSKKAHFSKTPKGITYIVGSMALQFKFHAMGPPTMQLSSRRSEKLLGHDSERGEMVAFISEFLKNRQSRRRSRKSFDDEQFQLMASRLEQLLFVQAKSFAEYYDIRTVGLRLQNLAYSNELKKKRKMSSSPESDLSLHWRSSSISSASSVSSSNDDNW